MDHLLTIQVIDSLKRAAPAKTVTLLTDVLRRVGWPVAGSKTLYTVVDRAEVLQTLSDVLYGEKAAPAGAAKQK